MIIQLFYDFSGKCDTLIEADIESSEYYNNGIGSYEFWGAPYFDEGDICVSNIKINSIKSFTYKNKSVSIRKEFYDKIKEYIINDDKIMRTLDEELL